MCPPGVQVALLWMYTPTGVASVTASGAAGVVYESSEIVSINSADSAEDVPSLEVRPIYSVIDKHRQLPGAVGTLNNEYVEIPALTRGRTEPGYDNKDAASGSRIVPSQESGDYALPADSLPASVPPTPDQRRVSAMDRGSGVFRLGALVCVSLGGDVSACSCGCCVCVQVRRVCMFLCVLADMVAMSAVSII